LIEILTLFIVSGQEFCKKSKCSAPCKNWYGGFETTPILFKACIGCIEDEGKKTIYPAATCPIKTTPILADKRGRFLFITIYLS
jgi:hypothetical protein